MFENQDAQPTRLIVGLGNPGEKYARTRHNLGYMVVDELARRFSIDSWKNKDGARQALDSRHKLVFVKPTSYMNSSGIPVRLIASWYRTPPQAILAITDDLDLPFGRLRMRAFGGHGGHNGLRSMIGTLGEEFARIRIGIGRPEFDAIDQVLGTFNQDESAVLPKLIEAAAEGAQRWLDEGIEPAMQFVNNVRLELPGQTVDDTG